MVDQADRDPVGFGALEQALGHDGQALDKRCGPGEYLADREQHLRLDDVATGRQHEPAMLDDDSGLRPKSAAVASSAGVNSSDSAGDQSSITPSRRGPARSGTTRACSLPATCHACRAADDIPSSVRTAENGR